MNRLRPLKHWDHGFESHSRHGLLYNIGFEVLTAVIVTSSGFWDVTPCNLLKVNRCFVGTCHPHIWGREISQARNQREAGSKQTFKMEPTCSSEALVVFRRRTLRCIPEELFIQRWFTLLEGRHIAKQNQ
jgi:hypothetical protein